MEDLQLTDSEKRRFSDLANELAGMEKTMRNALRTVESQSANKNTATEGGGNGGKYLLNPNFGTEFDKWYSDRDTNGKLKTGGYIRVGTTSDALQSIGVKDYSIFWDKSKLSAIMDKHPEMTPDVIKAVPNVMENPIIVMQSKTAINRITLYGEVTAADGSPVLVAMELKPQNKRGEILDFAKVASAYGRNTVQSDMNTSDILYVDPDKKRTNTWLEALRLQLPAGLTKYGPIGRVTYLERDVKGNFTIGDNDGKSSMQIALEKAQAKSKSKFKWLDNNGKNNWEYWKTYIQDKNNAIWQATLNVANATDGRKILYDINPIKK